MNDDQSREIRRLQWRIDALTKLTGVTLGLVFAIYLAVNKLDVFVFKLLGLE